jgi:hypothetical protein
MGIESAAVDIAIMMTSMTRWIIICFVNIKQCSASHYTAAAAAAAAAVAGCWPAGHGYCGDSWPQR